MTARRAALWESVFDQNAAAVDDDDDDDDSDAAEGQVYNDVIDIPRTSPFVSIKGQCLIPPFYANVASRGLNVSML